MSASQKRGRACEACSKIKIRCSLGQAADDKAPPCERCVRLNKDCVLSAPKRQKDRVAELEAQVAELTRLLHSQQIIQSPSDTPPEDEQSPPADTPGAYATATKKRRLELDPDAPENSINSPGTHPTETSDLQKLDQILSHDLQQRTLTRYAKDISPLFPMVPARDDHTLPYLRTKKCLLLLAFLYAASPGFLTLDTQEDLAGLLLDAVSVRAISHGEETLELIQVIQLASLWYRSPKHHRRTAVFQLVDVALALADDLGTSAPLAPFSKALSLDTGSYECVEAWRAWLGIYLLSTSMSIWQRKPVTAKWTEQHEQARMMLQYTPVNEDSDRWLAQYIKAEHMCHEVAELVELTNTTLLRDISEPSMRSKVQTCRNKILNWKMGIPQDLRSPLLAFWEHIATAYMHETVLHTATNMESFSAPYIAERLAFTDFPAPTITQDHVTAVYELTAAVQAVLDIFTSLDTSTLLASPGLVWAARAAYALYILGKLHVAVTAPGNTLGTVLDSSLLLLPEYADRLTTCGARIQAIDSRCGTARIMLAGPAIKEWYANYTQFLSSNTMLAQSVQMPGHVSATPGTIVPSMQNDVDLLSLSNIPADWENLFVYGESAADYGLGQLFAEPTSLESEQSALAGIIPASYRTK
ncbi:Putative zn(2)-C6 fungal-type DNA-binding domain-containing protein [Septoria linicola]|uniref:Zn(2)-C6 fungal-type DNA-binding domain-containing protein n=1 Tax=Septoria linicola TaxID=215465 RepID=A0A9Q9AIL0_9PEZI|nr:putative zn(2)-C6 fungal-type DNA-binding domain-containing protein [Septoria linicola]USW46858.1 Putative zn(2)-C6 fungal-type DNA-binding domain-containing protein [Septoria linicola]